MLEERIHLIENKDKKTYILVHGAWHGSWCWATISQNLEKQGHKVTRDAGTH